MRSERLMNRLNLKTFGALVVALGVTIMLSASSCESEASAGEKENTSRLDTYERLVKNQPAHTMDYSPTRATKNFWIDTWGKKGQLSYVYMMDGTGDVFGYFILEGLPVNYCTGLVPPMQEYKVEGDSSGQRGELGPAPSVDGTFSSSSNCNQFYGKDAVSGAYVEYTAGMGINPLLFNQPMPRYGAAKPMGDATLDKVN